MAFVCRSESSKRSIRLARALAVSAAARMIAMNEEARMALGRVKNLMIGGEALPVGTVQVG